MLCPMPDRPLDPPESGDDPEEIECECGAIFYPEERISRIVDHSVEHTCPVCGSTEMWLYEPRRDSTVKAIKDIALTFGDDYLRTLWDEETERHNGTPVMLRDQAE